MATELAKAYVQIIPSAKGIKAALQETLGKETSGVGEKTGETLGQKMVSTLKGAIAAAGIGKALSSSLTEGAALQQSLGGVETLFKKNADTVKKYAANAYKTAGMSANAYMETVTGFSASLLQGLGGDTEKASEVANMALTDMSDNANKIGTSMELIQNAYQGFAKQNYTMLDNLKLGYGGTKTEMQRLLKDAQKITGVKYDINNLSDVYNAIHVIQGGVDELNGGLGSVEKGLGITGTTAKEAATTLSGSFDSMKASFSNFLGNLTLGEDIVPSLQALVDTTSIFLFNNLIPAIGNIITALPLALSTLVGASTPLILEQGKTLLSSLYQGISAEAPALYNTVMELLDTMQTHITSEFPAILNNGVKMISHFANGALKNMPAVISAIGKILNRTLNVILESLPQILQSGVNLSGKLATGIIQNLPAIVSASANIIARMLATISSNLPKILQSGITLIGKLAAGIIKAIPTVIKAIPQVINGVTSAFKGYDWKSVGKNIIDGIAKGVRSAAGSIVTAAKEAAKNALEAAKEFLGIHSPSKVFEGEVGKMIALGLASGIENNTKAVSDAMKSLSAASVGMIDTDFTLSVSPATATSRQDNTLTTLIFQIMQLLQIIAENSGKEAVINWKDREVGRILREMGVVFA